MVGTVLLDTKRLLLQARARIAAARAVQPANHRASSLGQAPGTAAPKAARRRPLDRRHAIRSELPQVAHSSVFTDCPVLTLITELEIDD
jgi:hypothetical protein